MRISSICLRPRSQKQWDGTHTQTSGIRVLTNYDRATGICALETYDPTSAVFPIWGNDAWDIDRGEDARGNVEHADVVSIAGNVIDDPVVLHTCMGQNFHRTTSEYKRRWKIPNRALASKVLGVVPSSEYAKFGSTARHLTARILKFLWIHRNTKTKAELSEKHILAIEMQILATFTYNIRHLTYGIGYWIYKMTYSLLYIE